MSLSTILTFLSKAFAKFSIALSVFFTILSISFYFGIIDIFVFTILFVLIIIIVLLDAILVFILSADMKIFLHRQSKKNIDKDYQAYLLSLEKAKVQTPEEVLKQIGLDAALKVISTIKSGKTEAEKTEVVDAKAKIKELKEEIKFIKKSN
ncbi:hypothetical protein LCGC14_0938040 [marine sediment metagenome]|uniref:Uncharacterized protein n=1 Tax=marine sediment metagenome TaxID=412755 RepID=A0A0F9RS66_9ZZZZ|nr:hypothetical protein [bacterium]